MSTIIVRVTALKAMLNLAGVKDVRYYLNGVNVEATADETRYIATDGHVLGVYRDRQSNTINNAEGTLSVTIPDSVIKGLKVAKGTPDLAKLEVHVSPGGKVDCEIELGSIVTRFTADPAKYPDYTRVIPYRKPEDRAAGQFNPELLARFMACSNALRGTKGYVPRLDQYGATDSAVITDGTEDFVGVVMPMKERDSSGKPMFPEVDYSWARSHLDVKPEPVAKAA